MKNYDAVSYYSEHYSGASAEDWIRWHKEGAWPKAASRRPASDFPIEDGHGVVYQLLLPHQPFRRTLDIGCSAGDFILPIKGMSEESFGVDIASFPGAWDVLREHFNIQCSSLDLDKADLPFPDEHFSAVTIIMVLEHIFNVEHAVFEVSRVLERGGVAVIQVPNLAFVTRRLALFAGRLPITANSDDPDFLKSWDGQHLHNFTFGAVEKLLLRHGLTVENRRCFGRLAKLRSIRPSLLGADITVLARKLGTEASDQRS
jgi:SAM-dependent methyltransferase